MKNEHMTRRDGPPEYYHYSIVVARLMSGQLCPSSAALWVCGSTLSQRFGIPSRQGVLRPRHHVGLDVELRVRNGDLTGVADCLRIFGDCYGRIALTGIAHLCERHASQA